MGTDIKITILVIKFTMAKKLNRETSIGKLIEKIREANNKSQIQFSKIIDIERTHLVKIESGEIKKVHPTYLARIADEFSVDYWLLMEASGYDSPKIKEVYKKVLSDNFWANKINQLSFRKNQLLEDFAKLLLSLPDS